jgi:predicted transcriptional regulator
MYYQKVRFMDLAEITRRLRDGQNISQIATQTGRDRKTIRKYINEIKEISDDLTTVTDKTLYTIAEQNKKNKEKQKLYEPYLTEIKEHLEDEHNPLKIKSLYEVITVKYELSEAGSLSSFKRFLKGNNLRREQNIMLQMERYFSNS